MPRVGCIRSARLFVIRTSLHPLTYSSILSVLFCVPAPQERGKFQKETRINVAGMARRTSLKDSK